ncbi:DUF3046 domain-containing protein [Pontimonas sp.]|nr:DUF3046 domain-containing protein [Pontimonas sp.]
MTRSEFHLAVADEFGDTQGRALVRDLILSPLGHRSAHDALEDGVMPKVVWAALCEAMHVPVSRRHGVGHRQPIGDTPV